MKRTYLTVAVVACCAAGALAEVMPTLEAFPSTFPGYPGNIWQQTNGGADLYIWDNGGLFPFAVGSADPPVGIGDDYTISGTIKFVADRAAGIDELGFIARGDLANGMTYECSFDPSNGYFNLVKITGGTNFVNLVNNNTGLIPATDSEWGIVFSAETVGSNVHLLGSLYDSSGGLVSSIDYTDDGSKGGAPYLSGRVGTYSFKKSTRLEGMWLDMQVNAIPEPSTLALMGLSVLYLVRRGRK